MSRSKAPALILLIAMAAPSSAQDLIPPDPVTNLTAVATSQTSIKLTWAAPGDDVGGSGVGEYRISYRTTFFVDWDAAGTTRLSM